MQNTANLPFVTGTRPNNKKLTSIRTEITNVQKHDTDSLCSFTITQFVTR